LMNGLSQEEVQKRIEEGKVNSVKNRYTKSYAAIILGNTLTFFNLLNVGFFVAVLLVGSYKNGLFMLVILINTGIGIFQEIRTKRTLDSLSILNMSRVTALRSGEKTEIPVDQIVLDDVLVLKAGDQIPCDCVVLEGSLEVNESLLTGESDDIVKKADEELYSGSFITAGSAPVRVTKVGDDSYAAKIAGEAKGKRVRKSKLRDTLNKILKIVSFAIIPLCGLLFAKLYFLGHYPIKATVEQVAASGVGMIPEGLILLTSVSLTLGVLKLARQKTIVQDLYCIETLARVDVLCLDKTGTLTEGNLNVEKVIDIAPHEELEQALTQFLFTIDQKNATTKALSDYFGAPINEAWKLEKSIPFSSERKYSGASFEGHGSIYIGAVQSLFPAESELLKQAQEYASEGFRVITAARSSQPFAGGIIPGELEPLGLILMTDVIRKDCESTMKYFAEQDVTLKVISGDDPVTVSRIAVQCGLENAERYLDASTITEDQSLPDLMEEYTVFGRVRPDQKKEMIAALQEKGHTVAMTGDGVNDVLAFRQADCSVAMATGSDAAKHTADIVLLNSDFSSMPDVVRQGRRVINNICNASTMYLIKTMFSIVLTFLTVVAGISYPVQSVHLSVISAFAVGAP
ncbi:MAG: HAD-IC family P-type ATPase, partial [Lachnospiraceae bacterium]|nr:HAD-IC family P-type ATPase [Lachnospiraceae bacterium]